MRYFFLSVFMLVVVAACKQSAKGKNGVTYKSAVEYNDYIVNRQTSLMKNVLAFGNLNEDELDSAETYLIKYARQAQEMIDEIKGMPAYRGDSTLRDAAIRSFTFYKRIFEKDYVEILAIRKKGAENITEEDIAEGNGIVDRIGKEEEGFDKAFHSAQEDFARRNNMRLTDNKIQKEIDNLKED